MLLCFVGKKDRQSQRGTEWELLIERRREEAQPITTTVPTATRTVEKMRFYTL